MKQLTVRAQNPLINRVVLLNMVQADQDVIRAFTARLKGQANTCTMSTDSIRGWMRRSRTWAAAPRQRVSVRIYKVYYIILGIPFNPRGTSYKERETSKQFT